MDGTFLTRAERYICETRRRQRRRKAVTVLASAVVFCTTYALILPAITMEHICGMTEHTHTVDCYTQLLPPEESEAVCGLVENDQHRHTADCYAPSPAAPEVLTCESTDPSHQHNALCYGEWQLTCPLPEHIHDETCNAKAEPSEPLDDAAESSQTRETDALSASEDASPGAAETVLTGMLSLFSTDSASTAVPMAASITATDVTERADFEQAYVDDICPSDEQVNDAGGTNTYTKDGVMVGKTLEGTELENVFDITLTVKTPQKIEEVVTEPDMAVVIVMDISNTMTYKIGTLKTAGDDTNSRYAAAMSAAESFLDTFAANNTLGVSKVGYVAFNTDAHEIFGLQKCTSSSDAKTLAQTMRNKTGTIIKQNNYSGSHSRFTNIEAGLKMAGDMLNDSSIKNKNKFIIFLSDGFPTTYVQNGYSGWDPYNTGVYGKTKFYDHILNKYCGYGTSYSEEAAIKAREMANAIKSTGIQIFSIGVDVGSQKVSSYGLVSPYSTVDRPKNSYTSNGINEIGGENDENAFKTWLGSSIGSGFDNYYYDSTDTAGLAAAYSDIFQKIKTTVETNNKADWVATDPIPDMETTPTGEIEFIGLFDQSDVLQSKDTALSGKYAEGGEDTASYNKNSKTISWDLKKSGYTSETVGTTTTYTYQLKYRVRLKNEEINFIEYDKDEKKGIYLTNNVTYLRYKVTEVQNNVTVVSESRKIGFPIPAVHGYLGELTFQKVDQDGNPLANVPFTLTHDVKNCNVCHGDGVPVSSYDRLSDQKGTVYFDEIPSGHIYTLTETVPPGYSSDGSSYRVTVAYDKVTVTVYDAAGNEIEDGWTGIIKNYTYYELPATGGIGTVPYTLGGLSLLALAGLSAIRRRGRKGAGA